jgi:hypothetical protein
MLLLEGEASALAGRGVVSGIEEYHAPGSVERGTVKELTTIGFKFKRWRWLSYEIDFHTNSSDR